jgi:hypothetical protein
MYRNDLIQQAIGKTSAMKIAHKSGLSPDTVGRAKEGGNISVKSLRILADALGLQMVDLFRFDQLAPAPAEVQVDAINLQS